jgi:hypothetical protein
MGRFVDFELLASYFVIRSLTRFINIREFPGFDAALHVNL